MKLYTKEHDQHIMLFPLISGFQDTVYILLLYENYPHRKY